MPKSSDSVTIIDVARAAGVSVTTVSRVLNNKDDVSEQTYKRVSEVIDQLGYSSSLAAKSMRSRKTNVIGLIMPDVGDPFSIQVMKGVNRAIVELNYDLLVYTNGNMRRFSSAAAEQKYVSLLNSSITDGLIVVTPVSKSLSSASPVVAIDPNIDDPVGPAVISTNFNGAYEVTKYLVELGHRRIGYIGGRADLLSAYQRRQGYEQALESAGILLDDQLIVPGDYSPETATEQALRLLSLELPPTAIFAANDQSAIGALRAAGSRGVRVPQELSLAGFDNIPEAAFLNLTTVDQFIDRMGYLGTKMLFDLIQGKDLESLLQRVDTRLIVRGSCQAPAVLSLEDSAV